ncbi:WLM domain-containing protein [Chytridium lagenaria]|nr:WLM domain-containing protein [Chytridium lagenaria]
MAEDAQQLSFSVSFRGKSIPIQMPVNSTLQDLHVLIETHTQIPPQNQRLLHTGKILTTETLSTIRPHSKILMIGTSQQTIDAVIQKSKDVAVAHQNHQKYRVTSRMDAVVSYFGSVEVLQGFGDSMKARRLLERLRDDVGIREIMRRRGWVVGVLKELHPNEKTILGYNQNKGQVIALRLRTDELDGFRHYPAVKQVLLHELAHMVHSDHDNQFHSLNRLLNKEYSSYSSGHTVNSSSFATFRDEDAGTVDDHGYTGGSFVLGGKRRDDDRPMRELLAEAALLRLTDEEKEITESCGGDKE